MNVSIGTETQRLLEKQMTRGRFSDPDQVLLLALQTLDQIESENYEDLDSQTRASIEEGEAQYERGEGRAWEEVRKELRTRFVDRK